MYERSTSSHTFFIFCVLLDEISRAMGRKRNQGKARRAAKAKAREEAAAAERRGDDYQTANPCEQSLLSAQFLQQLQIDGGKCRHGFVPAVSIDDISFRFMTAFRKSYDEGIKSGKYSVSKCLMTAKDATWAEFAEVWKDSAKLEMARTFLLSFGTEQYLDGNYNDASVRAAFARFFEQHTAVRLEQTQALYNWPKIGDVSYGDVHTLVKFLRHRIPCSCLDKKYQEVKHITKLGHCYNPKCSIPGREVERSKTKYCSRCRCATYCSRECQEAHWIEHKPDCDMCAAKIAKFEVKRQTAEASI